jgi:3-deoxy-D-manno-octulosonic-acid transferase
MSFIYNLIIKTYQMSLAMAAPFHEKAAKMLSGRKGVFDQITTDFPTNVPENFTTNTQLVAWFHCASLGEFEQGRTLIEAFRKKYPSYKIVLTFFSPSGYEVRKNYEFANAVYYLPFDGAENAKKWFDLIKPSIIFFVKYEFWYYYLHEAKKRNIITISFSAIFRENQVFFKSYSKFYQNILRCFTHIFVQNQNSLNLLQSIDLQQVTIAGDTRFDRVIEIAKQAKKFPIIEEFKQQNFLLMIGSSWADDIAVLAPFINQFDKKLKIVIAPHEISENNLQNIENSLKTKKVIRYSQISVAADFSPQNVLDCGLKSAATDADILIIDNIGMLSSLYAYADVAFVGGGYGDGLHNILEAAVFGVPVLFGNKKYHKFQEAIDLLALQGAFSIQNSEELQAIFSKIYTNITYRKAISTICHDYVQSNQGGTEKIMSFLALININK